MKLLLLAAALWASGRGAEVAAVLSSESKPYRQAYEGMKAQLAVEPTLALATGENLRQAARARVIVTFGAKAALLEYPPDAALVVVMAPAMTLERKARVTRVEMIPSPADIIAQIKRLQPGLRRLGVIWNSSFYDAKIKEFDKAAAAAGVVLVRAPAEDSLPDRLRSLYRQVDGFWVPPDPLLLNAENFRILRAFSVDNKIPFYCPTPGLIEQGATAAIGPDFSDIGRTAGRAVKAAAKGQPTTEFYPAGTLVVSRAAAERMGLTIPAGIEKVLP